MRGATPALALTLALGGCVSTSMNTPNPTATEMLLPTHACEKAAEGLNLRLPEGTKAFLDTTAVGGSYADKYVIAAVRAHTIGHGVALTTDKTTADVIIELRVSADGIDDLNRVLGFPGTIVPSVTPGQPPLAIPELALWAEHQRSGICELSAIAYDAKTGRLVSAVGPIFAEAKVVNEHVLSGFVFGDELSRPGIRAGRE